MRDYLGWRKVFGVMTPSVNTCVEPEFNAMAPLGVTNQTSRIYVPNLKVSSNEDFATAIDEIFKGIDGAVDSAVTCLPDHLILGISALTVWGGSKATSDAFKASISTRAGGLSVTLPNEAIVEGLRRHGVKRKIAIVEPYFPIIQPRIESYLNEQGFEVARFNHMKGPQFSEYTRVSAAYLIEALRSVDSPDIEAIVQFGANLPMVAIADEAERWLGKPVIAVNAATYWHALRQNGIEDKLEGFTSLLSRF